MFVRIALIALLAASAHAQPARRALLIGIDDYTASTLPRVAQVPPDRERGWPDLKGAANDVALLEEMLVLRYGFRRQDIVTLKNQQATRAAILGAIERHLVRPARQGDVVFYYFAGHGGQVPNPESDELDRLDESIVPADSRRGAEDIRDKELRPLFNRILDRGAHLTLLLDHCHSGSGFRGLPGGGRPRGIGRARPIRDARAYGPRPEERGALVLVSAQDADTAWETDGDDGRKHGAFTWAWITSMRDAAAGEPVRETFLRAQARLRVDKADQAPAMLGSHAARMRPFLGLRTNAPRAIVAVERVQPDGEVVLQGGWAHGLAVSAELRAAGTPATLRVVRMLGVGRSVARMSVGAVPASIRSGTLLEVVRWAVPEGRPLRVWMPVTTRDLRAVARRFAAATNARWLAEPREATHVLRPRGDAWELLDRERRALPLASDDAAMSAIARLPRDGALFVQFPRVAARDAATTAGGTPALHFDEADYILTGRYDGRRIEYAWFRADGGRSSGWTRDDARLREDLLKLRRLHAWQTLRSDTPAPYRLALRHERSGTLVDNGPLLGGETYSVVLRATGAAEAAPRYYYVFAIDSHGKSYLVFPKSGSVENRFSGKDAELVLGAPGAFGVMPPYGDDTYVLLSTEEPLPDPFILAWDSIRARRALLTTRWSIERITLPSAAPPRRRASADRAAPRRR
ncbi:MAG TPA: caspase family protein [Thermoanaerobaculia bacterium]|nr:caspase family protein [Thermoanaerobaculia bacterium]